MDDPQNVSAASPSRDAASQVEVRGLGFALTAAALRALLDPATRNQAELVVDLSALSVRLPADAVGEVVNRVAPGLALGFARDEVSARLPDTPAVRVALPPAGVRVRVDAGGLHVGGDESSGDG